jgi:RinA family phage transcriptional activator
MKNNTFKKTERTLYNYRNIDLKIENIDLHIERLLNDVTVAGVSYEQKFPTNAFNSSVENEVIKREEHQAEEINHLKQMKNNTMTLKKLVHNGLCSLKEEEYKLVELRYLQKEKKSWVEIEMTLGMDNSTCHRMKNNIINTLTDLIYPNKANNDTF